MALLFKKGHGHRRVADDHPLDDFLGDGWTVAEEVKLLGSTEGEVHEPVPESEEEADHEETA